MAKRSAERITTGMVFSLKKNDDDYFCREIDSPLTEAGVNPPIGSELTVIKEPYTEDNEEYIDFTISGDTKQYTTYRKTFIESSKLIRRKPRPQKKAEEVTVTSTGPFNGFDIRVRKTQYEEYKYLNFSALKVIIEFKGTFSNGQRINAQAINKIKHSAGFAEKLAELIIVELDSIKGKVEETLSDFDPQKLDDFTKKYNGAVVETRYKLGRVAFDIYLTTSDYDRIKENIKKQVDCFVRNETKNLRYLNRKY